MDSFEQQMLVEIERCYKELNCSIRLSDTFNKQNGYFCEQSETTESNVSCLILSYVNVELLHVNAFFRRRITHQRNQMAINQTIMSSIKMSINNMMTKMKLNLSSNPK